MECGKEKGDEMAECGPPKSTLPLKKKKVAKGVRMSFSTVLEIHQSLPEMQVFVFLKKSSSVLVRTMSFGAF